MTQNVHWNDDQEKALAALIAINKGRQIAQGVLILGLLRLLDSNLKQWMPFSLFSAEKSAAS